VCIYSSQQATCTILCSAPGPSLQEHAITDDGIGRVSWPSDTDSRLPRARGWRCFVLLGLITGVWADATLAQTDTTTHGWPLQPFFSTHEITGTFCEFRNTLSSDHFHNGVDIPSPDGSPVYSVYDGQVTSIGTLASSGTNAFVRVRYTVSGLLKSDAYVHIAPNPALAVGSQVIAYQTVLGTILNGLGHVHFTHGDIGSEINAIRPAGGLTPYLDLYRPAIRSVRFFLDETETEFVDRRLGGPVDIRVHIEETNAASPGAVRQSTSNNGTYLVGYRVLSADGSTIVYEPPSSGVRYRFDRKPSNSDVHNAYATGSDLSTPIYTITNGGGADVVNTTQRVLGGAWNTAQNSPGPYQLMVWTEDTRGLADTVWIPVTVVEGDPIPPARPLLLAVVNDSTNRITVSWYPNTEADLRGYRLEFSVDGVAWTQRDGESVLTTGRTSVAYNSILAGTAFFRLTAVDSASPANVSPPSDVYGFRINATEAKTLLVDGFDRTEAAGSWHEGAHPFAMTHGVSLPTSFETCANDAVLDGSVRLEDYEAVVWLLGDESSNDETFTSAEQALVTAYLQGGGQLIVSGSEIAYDLGRISGPTAADRAFLHEYLKTAYAGDDAEVYTIEGVPGSPFESMVFRYGVAAEGAPYEEDWPDFFTPINGSGVMLRYGDQAGPVAGLAFRGLFPGGTAPGAVIVLGFPFETIVSRADRDTLMRRAYGWLDVITSADARSLASSTPAEFALEQNFPNPFNPTTLIRYHLPAAANVRLSVFDLLGREVELLLAGRQEAGSHQVRWEAGAYSSGVYLLRLQAADWVGTRRMILLK